MGSVYDWSLAAADNANADDSINWAEGQPPSSVNNSARAMMARLREFIGDLGGAAMASGTAAALNISSNAALHSLKSGMLIRFQAALANAPKTTLSLNNLPPKPIFKSGAKETAPLEGGEMQPGGIYECVYNARLGASGAWFLLSSFYTPPPSARAPSVPPGFIAPYCGNRPPSGWLACDGSWLNREAYRPLFDVIGLMFGADSRNTTFRLPDLRGEFIRGWADMRADAPQEERARTVGSWQRGKLESHRHAGNTDWGGEHNHRINGRNLNAKDGGNVTFFAAGGASLYTDSAGGHAHHFTTDWGMNDDGRMGEETRPRNIALLYCIKY